MTLSVRVVSEELAYNSGLKQYRMFIVDRPLVAGIKPRNAKGHDGRVASGEKLLTQYHTLDDHKRLLYSFSQHRKVSILTFVVGLQCRGKNVVAMCARVCFRVCVCVCMCVCVCVQAMQLLDQEVQLFKKNYLLLEAFLTEAAQRLESIIRKSYSVREEKVY